MKDIDRNCRILSEIRVCQRKKYENYFNVNKKVERLPIKKKSCTGS